MKRRRPAGPQAVLRRQRAVISPERVGADVRDDDLPVGIGRRAARAGRGPDGGAIDQAAVGGRQARRRAVPQMHAIGVQQEDGTERARHLLFQAKHQPVQHRGQRGGAHNQFHGALFPLHQLLRALALGDVNARADVALETALGGVARDALARKPSINSVAVALAVVHLERLAGIEGLCVDVHAAGQVVGMDAFGPAVAEFLLERAAGEVQPGLVEISAEFVHAAHPDQHGCGIGHAPEARFTFAQRLVRLEAPALRLRLLERAPHRGGEPFEPLFQQVVGRAPVQALHGLLLVQRAGNHDHRHCGLLLPRPHERRPAVEPRQVVVAQDQIERDAAGQRGLELFARVRPLHVDDQPVGLELVADQLRVARAVLQVQNADGRFHVPASFRSATVHSAAAAR